LAILAFIGQPVWAFWLFAAFFNLYVLVLAASRR
jgi:hypothetical protein